MDSAQLSLRIYEKEPSMKIVDDNKYSEFNNYSNILFD